MIRTEAALVIPDSAAIDRGQKPTFGGKGNKNAKVMLTKKIKIPTVNR
jgi:hypothetical protein